MKIFQKTLLIAAAALAFAACSEDFDATADNSEIGGLQPVGEKVTMTLNFSVPEMIVAEATPGSRAVAEDESLSVALDAATRAEGDEEENPTVPATAPESAIKNLWIMQFSGDESGSTLQVGQYYDSITNNTVSVDLYDNNGGKTTTYFIANVGNVEPLKSFTGKLSSFQALTFPTPEGGFGGAYMTSKGLPMVAKYDLTAVTGTQEIQLERICAKVVLTLKQDETFTEFEADANVNLRSAASKFYYHSNATKLTAVNANYIDTLVQHSINVANLKTGTSVTFYIPENMRGDGPSTTKQSKNWWNAPAHSSYLEVTGTYTNPSNGAKAKKIAYRIFPGADDTKNFDIKRNTCYNITATIKGANANGDGRVTSAEIINLSAAGTANCYLTHEAGQVYVFDASTGGNGATTQPFSATVGTGATAKTQTAPGINPFAVNPATAGLLWETGSSINGVIKNIKLDVENKKVYFSTAGMIGMPAIEGNALLAVNGSDGKVAWSWHIWSTQYDPDKAAKVAHTGGSTYYAMDRNLGASEAGRTVAAYGLLYQWGRKDPFLGSGMTAVGPKSTVDVLATANQATAGTTIADRIAYARQNPTTFICQRDAVVYDWIGITDWTTQADNLWGNPNTKTTINKTSYNTDKGAKSIYDPCPVGWRVPPQDTWIQFVKNVEWTNQYGSTTPADFNVDGAWSNGWKFYTNYAQTISTDYPAAGYRNNASGALGNVGTRGHWWSSSSYAAGNVYAGLQWSDAGAVNPLSYSSRASAFSVRCVQE